MKTAVLSLIATAALTAGLVGLAMLRRERAAVAPPVSLHTAAVTRGDLVSTIDATGRVGPEETVNVGTNRRPNQDPRNRSERSAAEKTIDFGSTVNEGMVLATIDDTIYRDQVDDAEATLQRTPGRLGASPGQARSGVGRVAAHQEPAADESHRRQRLRFGCRELQGRQGQRRFRPGGGPAERGPTALARTNLGYTVIRSPVQGVVIARLVNVGQTVVASFNAPHAVPDCQGPAPDAGFGLGQ